MSFLTNSFTFGVPGRQSKDKELRKDMIHQHFFQDIFYLFQRHVIREIAAVKLKTKLESNFSYYV